MDSLLNFLFSLTYTISRMKTVEFNPPNTVTLIHQQYNHLMLISRKFLPETAGSPLLVLNFHKVHLILRILVEDNAFKEIESRHLTLLMFGGIRKTVINCGARAA